MTGPITVFAPARVDLSPGFTDVEPFCTAMPARVVNVALDLGVEVTVRDETRVAPANSFAGRLRDAIACRLGIVRQVVSLSASALPPGSGLGVSGALSVALAFALSLRAGSSVDPESLVELACAAERDVGLTGGTQDQLASVYGGAGLVRRHRDVGRRDPIDADLGALGACLVLVHGRGSRNSGSIIERVLQLRSRSRVLRTVTAMNRLGDLLADSLREGDYDQLAGLVNESTALLRALHAEIVDDGIDNRLRALGASAAKPCGAGGPGAAWLVLVGPHARSAFVGAVEKAGFSVLPAIPHVAGAARIRPR